MNQQDISDQIKHFITKNFSAYAKNVQVDIDDAWSVSWEYDSLIVPDLHDHDHATILPGSPGSMETVYARILIGLKNQAEMMYERTDPAKCKAIVSGLEKAGETVGLEFNKK